MKININGFPLNKNGKIINDPKEIVKNEFLGNLFKEDGTYLFFKCKRKDKFIYTK